MSSSKLRGNRPAQLVVGTDSHKIQKTAKKPVIIYMVAPEIIHVEAGEFMSLVQRLTGPQTPPSSEKEKRPNTSIDHSREKGKHLFPVKVKARALNRATSFVKQQILSPQSPTSPALFFQDLSPLSRGGGGALKEGAVASQGWLHHHGDRFLGQTHHGLSSNGGLSPSFLDIFDHMTSHEP